VSAAPAATEPEAAPVPPPAPESSVSPEGAVEFVVVGLAGTGAAAVAPCVCAGALLRGLTTAGLATAGLAGAGLAGEFALVPAAELAPELGAAFGAEGDEGAEEPASVGDVAGTDDGDGVAGASDSAPEFESVVAELGAVAGLAAPNPSHGGSP